MAGIATNAIAQAVAARFGPGNPPAGVPSDIALATADPPNAIDTGSGPVVIVFTDSIDLRPAGNQLRHAVLRFRVQFLLRLGADLARDELDLRRWCGDGSDDAGLLYRLRAGLAGIHLGGIAQVSRAAIVSASFGGIPYGNPPDDYSGVELVVEVVTDEPWVPT